MSRSIGKALADDGLIRRSIRSRSPRVKSEPIELPDRQPLFADTSEHTLASWNFAMDIFAARQLADGEHWEIIAPDCDGAPLGPPWQRVAIVSPAPGHHRHRAPALRSSATLIACATASSLGASVKRSATSSRN